jgi:hypothetical protein
MTDEMVLVTMRLADMSKMHPHQIERVCSKCSEAVGVYPTGQRALKKHRKMKIICSVCTTYKPGDKAMPAGPIDKIIQEMHDSVRRQ